MENDITNIRSQIFSDIVRKVVRGIPRGQVLSYAQVAKLAGSPGAARAVGTVMKQNFDETVPCHRVVKSNGEVGDYNRGGRAAKASRLREEGAVFVSETKVFVSSYS
jgi:methylated-DNA-[protein]-cysteine S-methyltransferase